MKGEPVFRRADPGDNPADPGLGQRGASTGAYPDGGARRIEMKLEDKGVYVILLRRGNLKMHLSNYSMIETLLYGLTNRYRI
jgi:hypothetical protein